MNKIISTTGAPIEFTLNSSKSITIDLVTPIEVTDEELSLLQERLGNQISVVSDENKVDEDIETVPEEVEPTETVPEEVEPTETVPEEEVAQA